MPPLRGWGSAVPSDRPPTKVILTRTLRGFCRPSGTCSIRAPTQGLRPGLHYSAPIRLPFVSTQGSLRAGSLGLGFGGAMRPVSPKEVIRTHPLESVPFPIDFLLAVNILTLSFQKAERQGWGSLVTSAAKAGVKTSWFAALKRCATQKHHSRERCHPRAAPSKIRVFPQDFGRGLMTSSSWREPSAATATVGRASLPVARGTFAGLRESADRRVRSRPPRRLRPWVPWRHGFPAR